MDATEPKTKPERKERKPKEDEKPIEELFDLSKPIPKVEKPNKSAHEAALKELDDKIEALKADRTKVQNEIEAKLNNPALKAKMQTAREAFNGVRDQKKALIDEKKALKAQIDAIRSQLDQFNQEKKDLRTGGPKSIDEIHKQIKKLQTLQETTSMSLQDEKKLLKEIDHLEASKKKLQGLASKEDSTKSLIEQRKALTAQISAKDKEIDAKDKDVKAVAAQLDALKEGQGDKKKQLQGLFSKRDEVRSDMDKLFKEKDALRDAYRANNNEWYQYSRAIKAQRRLQYEAEKKEREVEEAAIRAKMEEEEAKKVPYEAEQALCDFLADYLERTYLGKADATNGGAMSDAVVPLQDDPFAGLTPAGKKDDDDGAYFGKGKGKKKRVRNKKQQDSDAGPFRLSVDTFEQFGLLQMSPPTSVEQVEASVKELRAKKEWYKEQPRGSVLTAADIRRASEEAAKKIKDAPVAGKKNGGKKQDAFSLSTDDFVPLSAATTAPAANASWGKASS